MQTHDEDGQSHLVEQTNRDVIVKVITLINCGRHDEAGPFRDWFVHVYGPYVAANVSELLCYIINLLDVNPSVIPEHTSAIQKRPQDSFDLTTEIWFESFEDYARHFDTNSAFRETTDLDRKFREQVRRNCAYEVDENYQILRTRPLLILGKDPAATRQSRLSYGRSPQVARGFWRGHAARTAASTRGVEVRAELNPASAHSLCIFSTGHRRTVLALA
jgi:hypothetical protein